MTVISESHGVRAIDFASGDIRCAFKEFVQRGTHIRLISAGNGMSMTVVSPLVIHWPYRDAQLRTLLGDPEPPAAGRVFDYNPKRALAIHIGTMVGTSPAIVGISETRAVRLTLL